ncbi:MAG: MBL fold metallo-hydrolase [Chloroflexota bacterium]|nr:MBL fold metallo-hydrolase [Chloroflexota bacterium]
MAKMIYRRLEIMPFGTNCYLVGSDETRDGMVIDPAGDAARILENIKELGLKISIIVATHTHPDHLGAAKQIKESTGAAFAVHAAEADNLVMADYSQFAAFDPAIKSPPAADTRLQDGDPIVVGDLSFDVLHTPGHSPGGICIAGYGVVFSGDALFNTSIGRTDGPGCSHDLLISSIRTKLLALPDQTVVLPGHGPKTTIGAERQNNPFLR